MKGTIPTLHCDGDGGMCHEWVPDEYAMDVSSVGGIRITTTERSPGWVSDPVLDTDLCPKHKEVQP